MNGMLVVVFDTEAKALEEKSALLQLGDKGLITVYQLAIVERNADGTKMVKKRGRHWSARDSRRGGTRESYRSAKRSHQSRSGGNSGITCWQHSGLHRTLIGEDFVAGGTKEVTMNRFAVVAEIEADSALVDSRVESVGGIVFRRALSDVKRTVHDEHVSAMKTDLVQMKAELARAHADHRAEPQKKGSQLDSKIQEQMTKVNERREAAERRDKAKVTILKTKASALKEKASGRLDG